MGEGRRKYAEEVNESEIQKLGESKEKVPGDEHHQVNLAVQSSNLVRL